MNLHRALGSMPIWFSHRYPTKIFKRREGANRARQDEIYLLARRSLHMNLDMLLIHLIDIMTPLVAADTEFFARAVLRIYTALDRQVSCNDIAETLGNR